MNENSQPITEANFDAQYIDSIEIERIDKFVCDEMDRQIHRYIKAMHGSKEVMDRFKRVREEAQRVDSVSGFFCRVPAGPWALAGKKGQAQEHCPDQYR